MDELRTDLAEAQRLAAEITEGSRNDVLTDEMVTASEDDPVAASIGEAGRAQVRAPSGRGARIRL